MTGVDIAVQELKGRTVRIRTNMVALRHQSSPGQVEVSIEDFDAIYLLIMELEQQLYK